MTKTTTKKTSPTAQMLALRKDANAATRLTTGVWYGGFDKVKTYALAKGLPFLAVWSNGDVCSYCKKFENNLLTDTFKKYLAESGLVCWFGHSKDAAKEDRVTGKAWAKRKTLKKYPFVRLYRGDGKTATTDVANSGNWWNGGKTLDKGAANIIAKITYALA